MNSSKDSFKSLKTIGCLIFDIALILAYFKGLGLFALIFPIKSILIFFVLLVGLVALNGAVICPSMLFKRIGVPYCASAVTMSVLYAIVSNIFSIIFVSGSTVWYIVWELIVFAVFIVIFSIVGAFSKSAAQELAKAVKEQNDKTIIMEQLLEIENILTVKENQDDILQCRKVFKKLKERIQASTPFGRISGNSSVLEIENQIKNKLESLKVSLHGNLTYEDLIEMEKLIEDIRRLVINRETLNIK